MLFFIHYRHGARSVADVGEQIAERGLRFHRQRGVNQRRLDPLPGAEGCFQRINRDNPDKAITALYDGDAANLLI